MESELTGRKVKISKQLQTMADEGLSRIEKIVGRGASAHIIFSSQKHAQIAEVTVNARHHTVVGLAEAPDIAVALRTALEKTEKQVIRWKKSLVEKKRQSKPISSVLPATPEDAASRSDSSLSNGKARSSGLHIVPAPEALAEEPMTLEEAVKEAESRNQQVFVFRDMAGLVKVLHCAGDGLVRLIEVE
ncbi:MAG TPA: HPF/RaiA family ribosome-associated protein [Acidobacteriaceae bacterium]|nr:HPF/RaiA family ribosome-associated protein [Acidobacteriaceae bacterium]